MTAEVIEGDALEVVDRLAEALVAFMAGVLGVAERLAADNTAAPRPEQGRGSLQKRTSEGESIQQGLWPAERPERSRGDHATASWRASVWPRR